MPFKGFFSIAIIFVLLNSCNNNVPGKNQTSAKADSLKNSIDSLLKETISRFKIPGIAVAVTKNDSVIYEKAFGLRNIESGEKLTTKSVFHWASVSKTFVACAIMQLVEKGKISLDEKVIKYLPGFQLKNDWYKNITIKQLLNHTSGVKDVEDYDWEKPQTDENALERYVLSMKSDEMDFENGTNWSYSNNGFEILGAVIAKVSGISFEDYMKQNIFEPLGMRSSSFIYNEIPETLRVSPHIWHAKVSPAKTYPYNRIHAPSSTLNSSIEDMSRWAMANLRKGESGSKKILSARAYDQLWNKTYSIDEKTQIGLCWFLSEIAGTKIVFHSGSDPGFQSFLILCPEKNISVVVASNYENTPVEDIGGSLLLMMLGKKPKQIKQEVLIPYAEKLQTEGRNAAEKFYSKATEDTASYINTQDNWIFGTYTIIEHDSSLKNLFITLLRKNKEIHPLSADANFYLGYGFNEIGNKDSSGFYAVRALEYDPKHEGALELLKTLKHNK